MLEILNLGKPEVQYDRSKESLASLSWFGLLNCSGRGSRRAIGAHSSPGRQEFKTADVAKRQAKWSLEPKPLRSIVDLAQPIEAPTSSFLPLYYKYLPSSFEAVSNSSDLFIFHSKHELKHLFLPNPYMLWPAPFYHIPGI